MVTNRCRWVRRRLAILAGDPDGRDLRWDDRRRVERHLIACPPCRAELSALESAVGALRTSASVSPIDPDLASIWPAVSQQIRRSRHLRRPALLGLGAGPAMGLAASLLVVGGLIGLAGWRLGSASASRSYEVEARASLPRPRPALPEGPALIVSEGRTAPRTGLDLAPKAPAASNLRDPQRSQ